MVRDYTWLMDSKGYIRTERNYEALKLHRLIVGNPRNKVVNHINHNPADNRKENLRIVTQRENAANQQIQKRRKTSRYKDVLYRKSTGKWIASIKVNQKHKHIGCFDSEEEAARAAQYKEMEGNEIVNEGILIFGPDDFVTANRLAATLGNEVAIFMCKSDGTAPSATKTVKHLYVIGGKPSGVGHPNETVLAGPNWFATVAAVGKKL